MVYNNEDFVERTLLSILENNTENFDVIINDDCSTDNSVSVIKQFLLSNNSITKQWRLNLNKSNLGINASIKNILSVNKNSWVKYIAGDDEFELDSLLEYYQIASKNNPNNCIAIAGMNFINEYSKNIGKRSSLSSYFYENDWLKTTNLYINTINAPSVMIGREPLLAALDETKVKNVEDWPLLRFCISRNFNFKVHKDPLIKYRFHKNSLSSQFNDAIETKNHVKRISNEVEILLNENILLSDSRIVQLGIYIQIKCLKADNIVERFFYKTLKLINIQFVMFRILALIDSWKK